MKKFKIVPYDLVNDIWLLKERVFPLIWVFRGTGNKKELEEKIKELSN